MTRRRKLAATAATAAIAVASPATAAKPAKQRVPTGPGKARVSTIASPPQAAAQQTLEAMRRAERQDHRRRLASALAAELPRAEAGAVELGLAAAEADPARLADSLARFTGASESEVADAFEAMARSAREAALRS